MKEAFNSNSSRSKSRRSLLKKSIAGFGGLQLASLPFVKVNAMSNALNDMGIGAAFKDHFSVGVALNTSILTESNSQKRDIVASEFTTISPENLLKWERIKPDGQWFWDNADKYVDFGTQNNMYTVGHTLVWHSQIPQSEFFDEENNPLGRGALLAKMHEHISTLVGRYRGRINAWDVVNEAIDDGRGFRLSNWHDIIGDDFMEHAFHYAHQADPEATLLYNDFNMHNPAKRDFLVELFTKFLDKGVPIHAVGFQGHVGMDYPDFEELEKSIEAYAALGLKVHISELDVDVLPNPYASSAEISNRFSYSPDKDPYIGGLPEQVEEELAQRYQQLFSLFMKHEDTIDRVCMWGLSDALSWKNDFPINGRTNYPLLFDRELAPKAAYFRLLDLV